MDARLRWLSPWNAERSRRRRGALPPQPPPVELHCREIAEADGFSYVLEKGAGIVYAPPALELTMQALSAHPSPGGKRLRTGRGKRRA